MTRNLARARITARTPISVEREFSLFHRDSRPTRRSTTERFMQSLSSRLARDRFEVVEEVAGNAFELKVCFSSPGEIREDLRRAYREIIAVAQSQGLLVSGISSPVHSEEFNDFFTTMAFPLAKRFIGRTNSIHIHFGGETEEELIRRYAASNLLAPILLDVSQSSIIDGVPRGRANQLCKLLNTLPEEMANPIRMNNLDSFFAHLEIARRAAQEQIDRTLNGESAVLCQKYPELARINGHGFELLRLTPDKLFSLARIRPDKRSNSRGLMGSVELRSMDGQANLDQDLALIEFALGALSYIESRMEHGILSEVDINEIRRSIDLAARCALHTDNGRRATAQKTQENAITGLNEMDLQPEYIHLVSGMIAEPNYITYVGLNPAEIIRESARDFMVQ